MSLTQRIVKALEALLKAVEANASSAMADGMECSHDTIYRALLVDSILAKVSEIAIGLKMLVGELEGGYLVLDDTVIARSGRGKMWLPKLRDGNGHYCYGFGIVLLIWTDGKVRIPLKIKLYFGEVSKQELALELLAWAKEKGLKPDYVLFDSWYGSKKILKQIHAYSWSFVTRLKKNRVLRGKQLKRHRGPYWTKVGKLRGMDFEVKIVRRGNKYYVTNDLELEDKEIISHYKVRQAIEEVIRGLKQELGWQGFRYRTEQTIGGHLGLGVIAYGLIEVARRENKQSFYRYRRGLISGRIDPPLDLLDLLPQAA